MFFHTEEGLVKRVQRQNKDRVCVEKWGESLGGHDVVRNSGDNEERWCVLCLVSVFRSSLLSFFRPVLDSGFRRRGREKQGLVRVENFANVFVCILSPLSCRQYGHSMFDSGIMVRLF
jgi:hypothetical protein